MAGAHVQTFTEDIGAGTTANVTVSGATSNNLLIGSIAIRGDAGTIATPTGWTLIEKYDASGSNDVAGGLYYRIASGTSADDFSTSWDNGLRLHALVSEYSGLASSTPLEASGENTTYVQTSTTSLSTGSATAVQATGTAILMMCNYKHVDFDPTSLASGTIDADRTDQTLINHPETTHGHLNYTSAGSKSDTWSTTGTGNYAYAAIAVFKAASSGTEISASAASMTLTELQASVAYDINVSSASASITVTPLQATVSLDVNISASASALSLTQNAASITYDVDVQANAAALTLTPLSASITAQTYSITTNLATLSLTPNAASIAHDINVAASLASLSLTPNQSLVSNVTGDVGVATFMATFELEPHRATIYKGYTYVGKVIGVDVEDIP